MISFEEVQTLVRTARDIDSRAIDHIAAVLDEEVSAKVKAAAEQGRTEVLVVYDIPATKLVTIKNIDPAVERVIKSMDKRFTVQLNGINLMQTSDPYYIISIHVQWVV